MRIHILGICGTFMGGIALLARELGHDVTGSDTNVYPPMSTQLEKSGIPLYEGYGIEPLIPGPDIVVIGNTLSRGNVAVEYVLDEGLRYCSGPQWLAENVLYGRHVLAVSGTHGKTTCTAMLAWVLERTGKAPGFLIGGVAENFGLSARSGAGRYFVVEADEYDTAFFDKRSKFIHYSPRTLVINNIEYDHADIFGDIEDIKREFSRLLRIIPGSGRIVYKENDPEIQQVLATGCWTPTVGFGADSGEWQFEALKNDFSSFKVLHKGVSTGSVKWDLIGRHNAENALAVIAAAEHAGVDAGEAADALSTFRSVKRRLQQLAVINGITIYDDFAHHPTAIRETLSALRCRAGDKRIFAVFEPRSNTMKMGIHQATLGPAFAEADRVLAYRPGNLSWDLNAAFQRQDRSVSVYSDTGQIIDTLAAELREGDHVLVMSNGAFENIHDRLINRLQQQ